MYENLKMDGEEIEETKDKRVVTYFQGSERDFTMELEGDLNTAIC